MTFSILLLLVFRLVMAGCAILLAIWVRMPVLGLVGLGLSGLSSLLTPTRTPIATGMRNGAVLAAWVFSAVVVVSAIIAKGIVLDPYYSMIAWCVAAAAVLAASTAAPGPARTWWKRLSMTWAFIGVVLWLGWSYWQDLPAPFYVGLAFALLALIALRVWFRLGPVALQTVNTVILIVVVLPLVDLATHPPRSSSRNPADLRNYYCYRTAKENPAAFERWWRYFWIEQWVPVYGKVVMRTDGGVPKLIPNSCARLVDSELMINSEGFRGAEIPKPKGRAYRIVALGESSTFGLTINRQDKPWPELLQARIRARLKPDRPVEVINAGFPGITLEGNLQRMREQILPLKPDMLISYHGINGFRMLDRAMPPIHGRAPPAYRERAIHLLAECEFRLKLMYYRHRQEASISAAAPTFQDIEGSHYAQAYHELIETANTNHIRLVIANFSMALNEHSAPEVVEFFRSRTFQPYWYIKANLAHSRLVEQLAKEHPDVCRIDTHRHLDGVEDEFIDLVHFAHSGEEQMAENVFKGIEGVLRKDLSGEGSARPEIARP